MRSMAELSKGYRQMSHQGNREVAQLATAGVTDMSTTQIGTELLPTIWKQEVIQFGESLRILDQFAIINKDLLNQRAVSVTIPITTSHLSIDTAPASAEGDVRDLTEITNVDTVTITFVASDWKKGAIGISKQLLATSAVDLIKQAKFAIAQDIADDVDLDLASTIQDTAVTNNVFGGASGNADASDLATGDVLTTDIIIDAMQQLWDNDWEPKVLVVGPAQYAALLKDSQFTNASEYGSNKIVLTGEIGEYLDMKVIKTTNANFKYAGTDTDINDASTWAVAGHTCPIIGVQRKTNAPVAYVLVWKEMPTIDSEFWKDEARQMIYYDQAFKSAVIQPLAISLIKVTDS